MIFLACIFALIAYGNALDVTRLKSADIQLHLTAGSLSPAINVDRIFNKHESSDSLITTLVNIQPTTEPTTEPTIQPSQPPHSPTTAPTTSTMHPSRTPTAAHTSASPTVVRTPHPTGAPVSLNATQQINGVAYSAYLGNQVNCDAVFLYAISYSSGISEVYIHDIHVTPVARRLSALRVVTVATDSDAVTLQYAMKIPSSTNSGFTYSDLKFRVTSGVTSGHFTSGMRHRAYSESVSELIRASSSSVTTVNTTPGVADDNTDDDTSSTSHLSAGVIGGIVVGCFALVGMFSIVVCCGYSYENINNTDRACNVLDVASDEISNPTHIQDVGV